MAIAYVDVGTNGAGTTAATGLAYPAAVTAGNLLVLTCVSKYSPNLPSTPDGFTFLARKTGGAGAAGVGSGLATISMYYRIATGAEDGSGITLSLASGNVIHASIHQYSKAANRSWGLAASSGTDDTSGTGYSVVADTDPGVAINDLVLLLIGFNGNTGISGSTLAATGATFGVLTERLDGGSATGDDVGHKHISVPVSAGLATTPMTCTTTAAGATSGPMLFVRLRELVPATVGSAEVDPIVQGITRSITNSIGKRTV
jgi:hypothetical protein